jgi:hypothetical protein
MSEFDHFSRVRFTMSKDKFRRTDFKIGFTKKNLVYSDDQTSRLQIVLDQRDEMEAYRLIDEFYVRQKLLRDLAEVLGIRDESILEEFANLGFTPRTAPAIEMLPMAFVAWANNSVTEEECTAAVRLIHDSQLSEFPATWHVVQAWLDVPPSQELWELWVRYLHARFDYLTQSQQIKLCREVLNNARIVARASGGWLGFGSICKSEEMVIDAIEAVFERVPLCLVKPS